jgi:hypothetical protein
MHKYNNIDDILNKVPGWKDRLNKSALLSAIVYQLTNGCDPYLIMDQLITSFENQSETMMELIHKQPPRPMIIQGTPDLIKQLKDDEYNRLLVKYETLLKKLDPYWFMTYIDKKIVEFDYHNIHNRPAVIYLNKDDWYMFKEQCVDYVTSISNIKDHGVYMYRGFDIKQMPVNGISMIKSKDEYHNSVTILLDKKDI